MKPITFLIFASLIYTLISHFFHVDEIIPEDAAEMLEKSPVGDIMSWTQANFDYANIIMGIFFAMCLKMVFRKYPYNFFEIMIALCFIMGQGMLLLTAESFFAGVLSKKTFILLTMITSVAYPTWAIAQFYDKTKAMSYVKAFFAYILGYILFYIAIFIVGVTAALIIAGQ